jgi:predicted GH43/DUF377 family glycosyl hydrolase
MIDNDRCTDSRAATLSLRPRCPGGCHRLCRPAPSAPFAAPSLAVRSTALRPPPLPMRSASLGTPAVAANLLRLCQPRAAQRTSASPPCRLAELWPLCPLRSQRPLALIKWLLFLWFPLFAVDLEEHLSPFVLETKQILVPEFPHAFNPSIIRTGGRLLLSFRVLPNLKDKFQSDIYLVWLDEEWNPISKPQRLDLRQGSKVPCRADEARLVMAGGQLYLVYSDNPEVKISRGGFRMHIAELNCDGHEWIVSGTERILEWEGQNGDRREKNWVPFEYQEELLLAYSLSPHKIFCPIFGTESCETIASTCTAVHWNWGELRGGTPALRVGDEYLGFFHSQKHLTTDHSDGESQYHYFMGAYTFSANPPFQITRFSPEPIWGKNFYHGANYKPYWAPMRVIFPCGYILDDPFIWVAYGRQDHECWIAKIDKSLLLSSLCPISPKNWPQLPNTINDENDVTIER